MIFRGTFQRAAWIISTLPRRALAVSPHVTPNTEKSSRSKNGGLTEDTVVHFQQTLKSLLHWNWVKRQVQLPQRVLEFYFLADSELDVAFSLSLCELCVSISHFLYIFSDGYILFLNQEWHIPSRCSSYISLKLPNSSQNPGLYLRVLPQASCLLLSFVSADRIPVTLRCEAQTVKPNSVLLGNGKRQTPASRSLCFKTFTFHFVPVLNLSQSPLGGLCAFTWTHWPYYVREIRPTFLLSN